ncbi:MAG: methyltransferase domain-containing protein, partial [Aeromicrobium sp.]
PPDPHPWRLTTVTDTIQRGRQHRRRDAAAPLTPDTHLGQPFDLILASEVVEHVVDPLSFVTALRTQLKPGGTVILTTPDAAIVRPTSADHEALNAISPGFHAFVATQGALTDLMQRAGFDRVDVVREGGTLRATATVGAAAPPALGDGAHPVRRGELAYLRDRSGSAPPGSALAVGMAVRLLRALVAAGTLDEADDVAQIVLAAFRDRYGADLAEPRLLLDRLDAGAEFPWSAAGAAFALGSLDLHLHANPQRAADFFGLTARLAAYWSRELDTVDLDVADLRFQGAYHQAFAQTRFAPADAVRNAFGLADHLDPTQPDREELVDASLCRLFVELVAQGHRDLDPLQEHLQATAARTARSENETSRVAGLDALYALGVVHRDAGEPSLSQAALIECISICDGRRTDDEHAARLAALCRATLPPTLDLGAPSVRATTRRFRRVKAMAARLGVADEPVHWMVDTYWSDTSGAYLDGWAHLRDTPIRQVSVENGGVSILASRHDRADLATHWPASPEAVHGGFSVYLPGRISFPLVLALHTDDGIVTSELNLSPRPLPEHPSTPSVPPDRRLRLAMRNAPDGPALALGVRALSKEIADARAAILGNREVVGLDIHPGFGVDVVGDVHRLSALFPPDHFAVVYSAALLEHVAAPWLVAAECAKVLKPGGIAVHLAPWVWPTHSQPNDFWRFSDRGLASLFHESLGFRVLGCGGSGGAVIIPTPDWRLEQIRFPTHSSPAMSWVIAEKVADPDPAIAWPYSEVDIETAQEYPLDGLCDSARVAP